MAQAHRPDTRGLPHEGRRLQRGIGVVILGMTAGAATMLWLALTLSGPEVRRPPDEGVLFGVWEVFYDTQAPSVRVLLVAVSVALLLAAGVASVKQRIASVARRSGDSRSTPSPRRW